MAALNLILWLVFTCLCQALPASQDSNNASSATPEVVYEFLPTMIPENAILRSNGQLLVTCLVCATLSQVDPNLGPTQERRSVFTFPDGVINVLGIDELSEDIFAVAVGQLDITDPLNLTSPHLINGPTGVWVIDLRDYQAPTYDSSLVRAHRVGGGSLAGLFDGLAVINSEKGLLAATDVVEGNIWLIDIPNNSTTVLVNTLLLEPAHKTLASSLLANGLKYRNGKLYFTASITGTYGYIPVDPSTGKATGPINVIYDYGFSLDDFNFGPSGDAYFTTFAKLDGGILRRKAGTPSGQADTEKVLSYFGTNSVIPRTVNGNCELLMTVFLQFQVARFTIPGPC